MPVIQGAYSMKNISTIALFTAIISISNANACTGITLHGTDGTRVAARTIDWSGEEMENIYVVAPRGLVQKSILPDGTAGGVEFTGKYGYAGLGMEQREFVIDGTNEAGLNAALFYFPKYGKYVEYDPQYNDVTLSDFQVVSWILAQFSTIDEVRAAIKNVRIVNIDSRSSTVHWRITEPTGRQVVLEIIDGVPQFYENDIGVITNAPGFMWHKTNLNNYVNLQPGTAGPIKLGDDTLTAFGAGSGFLGLPGDMTPPSRFVRAAFFQNYSIQQSNAAAVIRQAFHILNTFDVPLGIQFAVGKSPTNMPSATQWTIASDLTHRVIYYHTMYNRAVRSLDMNKIDFETVAFQSHPLDVSATETIIPVTVY